MSKIHLGNVSSTLPISLIVGSPGRPTLFASEVGPTSGLILQVPKSNLVAFCLWLPSHMSYLLQGHLCPSRVALAQQPLSMPYEEVLPFVYVKADPRPPYALRG